MTQAERDLLLLVAGFIGCRLPMNVVETPLLAGLSNHVHMAPAEMRLKMAALIDEIRHTGYETDFR